MTETNQTVILKRCMLKQHTCYASLSVSFKEEWLCTFSSKEGEECCRSLDLQKQSSFPFA